MSLCNPPWRPGPGSSRRGVRWSWMRSPSEGVSRQTSGTSASVNTKWASSMLLPCQWIPIWSLDVELQLMRCCLNRDKEKMKEQRSELFVFGWIFVCCSTSWKISSYLDNSDDRTNNISPEKDVGVDEHWFKCIWHAESFWCRDFITSSILGMSCYTGTLSIKNLRTLYFPNFKVIKDSRTRGTHGIPWVKSLWSGTATEIRSTKWRWPSCCWSPSTTAPCGLVLGPWRNWSEWLTRNWDN